MLRPRQLLPAFVALALIYAALAGLRTVGDADLGWTLATGRSVVQHHRIFSDDVFSYTARGREWIYPPFSGVAFYLVYLLGGFKAISWFAAAACASVVAIVLCAGGSWPIRLFTAALAALAVPLLAVRTTPRADLFSTLLFAPVLVILWRHSRGRPAPLWLLVPLMCAWANLHLGFAAGLVLFALYAAMECLEMLFPEERANARSRLRAAAPWLGAAAAATLLNPWGWRLYVALWRQNRLLKSLEGYVGDWIAVWPRWTDLRQFFFWRNPESGYWWLAALSLVAIGIALRRKRLGTVLLLAIPLLGSLRYLRFQALFAMVAVIVAGEILGERKSERTMFLPAALLAGLVLLVGVRSSDLVSNRFYLSRVDNEVFGPGPSWWYPERAAAFLLRERLPGRILNDYNLGGYLTWRLGPDYPVSLDGRAVPYGPEIFFQHKTLFGQPPDSPEWETQAERWGFNTLLVSTARYTGLGTIPLRAFCESRTWRPVYLDETGAVFLLNRAQNASWIERLQIDCSRVPFTAPPARNAADLYNFYSNAGAVLFELGRNSEALESLGRAQKIFAEDPHLYLIRGAVYEALGMPAQAEEDYRASLRLAETDRAWFALGQLQAAQGRYDEAAASVERAARQSLFPHEIYRVLGQLDLLRNRPKDALEAFDQAEMRSPYSGAGAALGTEFRLEIAAGRARAWRQLGDLNRAVSFQEQTVTYAPRDAARWRELAELYRLQGRADRAQDALNRADSLK